MGTGCILEGEPQIVYPIGMMLLGTAAIAVPFYFAKQSQILCYIIVGAFVGAVKTPNGCTLAEEMHLSVATSSALFDLGILFVLFMGGMEVDLQALKKSWFLVLVNGMGQICLNLASFCIICMAFSSKGMAFEGMENPGVGTFFFGICCTLSSTILVLGGLKKRNEMAAMHGQIILGLMVLQDITAVLAIAVMASAFNPTVPSDKPIGVVLGGLIMWLVILPLFLFVLNKYALDPLFKFFAKIG